MITFREKDFSLKDDMIAGTMLGAIIGGGSSAGMKAINSFAPKDKPVINESNRVGRIASNSLASAATGAIIGAGLGGLYYLINRTIGKSASTNKRKINFTSEISNLLNKFGYKEGIDFTFDPKTANQLKSQVCIVVSRSSDELSLIVNTINDKKFDTISNQIIKNLPSSSIVTRKKSDKWNEISISSISSNNQDAGFMASLAEKFIQRKYPVYIVEVG